MRAFIKRYWIEVAAGLAVLIGAVLLIDFSGLLNVLDRLVVALAARLTLTTALGLGLILLAAIILAWRVRARFLQSAFWRTTVCPKCGSPLFRVHRRRLDRMLGKVFLPHSRRYRCSKQECGWTGLRHSRRHAETG